MYIQSIDRLSFVAKFSSRNRPEEVAAELGQATGQLSKVHKKKKHITATTADRVLWKVLRNRAAYLKLELAKCFANKETILNTRPKLWPESIRTPYFTARDAAKTHAIYFCPSSPDDDLNQTPIGGGC